MPAPFLYIADQWIELDDFSNQAGAISHLSTHRQHDGPTHG
jgi:hypothetical protein